MPGLQSETYVVWIAPPSDREFRLDVGLFPHVGNALETS